MKSIAPWLGLVLTVAVFMGCQQPTSSGSKDSNNGTTTTTTTDSTAPGEVVDLAVTAGNGQIVLTWTDPSDSDLSKVVISSDSFSTEVAKGAGTATISGLTNRSAYAFRVKTKDTSGNLSSGIKRGAMPVASNNTATLNITLPSSDSSILAINSTNTLRIEVYSDLTQAQARTPIFRDKFKVTTGTKSFTIPALMTLYVVGYFDYGDDGVDTGDLVGDIIAVSDTTAASSTLNQTYYPLTSNFRAGKALVADSDLAKILHLKYTYSGGTTTDANKLRGVVTTSTDPTVSSAWVYSTNGGGLTDQQRVMIGLDATKSYYFFMYLDMDIDDVLDSGERRSTPAALTLVNLASYTTIPSQNTFTYGDGAGTSLTPP